jgi:uncharacterized protein involved in exopolysaccharide biosynthesis
MAKIDELKSKVSEIVTVLTDARQQYNDIEHRLEALEKILASHLTSSQIAAVSTKMEVSDEGK